jgi:putative aldouronate transport system substrate-binding protein
MNVSEPAQYASIGQPVEDAMKDVRAGRKPMSAFDDAVKSWKAQGGDALAAFYEDIRTKFGTGQ